VRKELFIGLDLGQVNDPTALSITERVTANHPDEYLHQLALERRPYPPSLPAEYHVRHLDRWVGMSYPEIIRRVGAVRLKLPESTKLIIDATGCGLPVFDMMKEDGLKPIGIWFTGGDTVTRRKGGWNVPKRDLAATLAVLSQSGRIKVAKSLPEAATLWHEMTHLRAKIDLRTGHETVEHWRESDHDDLVFSVAVACWYAETKNVDWTQCAPISRRL
jgi:hypothetical protein